MPSPATDSAIKRKSSLKITAEERKAKKEIKKII